MSAMVEAKDAIAARDIGVRRPDALSHPKYRPDIDGLRAIAVLSVVAFHAFPSGVVGGFIGVDIFFVISGFLISTIILENLERGSFSFVEFYSRRIRRIFPALSLVLIASYAFGWLTLLPEEYKQLGKHIAGGAGFVSNFILWTESGYFDTAAETKPLLHLWSLGIEEQFYIAWPLLLWLGWKRQLNLLTITIAVACMSFALNIREAGAIPVAAFYSPQTRFWELLTGSALAWAALHKKGFPPGVGHRLDVILGRIVYAQAPQADGSTLRHCQSIFGAAFIACGLLLITRDRHFPGWWALLPTLGAVLIISAGPRAWFNRVVLSNGVMVWFGLISFPLYLWHWPLLSFMRVVEGTVPSTWWRVGAVLAAIVLAWVTYRLVEKPLRFGPHGRFKAIALAVVMLGAGYAGYNDYSRDGLPFRLPKEFADTDFEYLQNIRANICHVESPDTSVFHPSCFETARPLLALWGDSHASALYPGLRALQDQGHFGILQLTAAACPPIFGLDDLKYKKDCNGNNEEVFKTLQAQKPDILILHAAWLLAAYPMTMDVLKSKLRNTLEKIKAGMPATKIIIIGPVPRWDDSPKKVAFLRWRNDAFRTNKLGTREKAMRLDDLDHVLRSISIQYGAGYISPISYLCNDGGCISKVGGSPLDWIATDAWHFSPNGSRFFVGLIKDKLFGDAAPLKH